MVAPLERGECDEWDAEEIKAEGRRLLGAERQAGSPPVIDEMIPLGDPRTRTSFSPEC